MKKESEMKVSCGDNDDDDDVDDVDDDDDDDDDDNEFHYFDDDDHHHNYDDDDDRSLFKFHSLYFSRPYRMLRHCYKKKAKPDFIINFHQ